MVLLDGFRSIGYGHGLCQAVLVGSRVTTFLEGVTKKSVYMEGSTAMAGCSTGPSCARFVPGLSR